MCVAIYVLTGSLFRLSGLVIDYIQSIFSDYCDLPLASVSCSVKRGLNKSQPPPLTTGSRFNLTHPRGLLLRLSPFLET